ncbi:DUF3857 domain-containing protein [bacterium]|nr:DUF3857 domain-containing protein [bacterium]
MIFIFFILISLVASPALCEDIPSWVSNALVTDYTQISDKTDAIMLLSDTQLSYDNGVITSQEKRLYKIIRLDGFQYGSLVVSLVKGSKISNVRGYRLSGPGKLLEKLKKKNIVRRAYNVDFYDDAEQLFANFEHINIGDLIAFEYKVKHEPFFKHSFYEMGSLIEIAVKCIHTPPNVFCSILNDPENSVIFSGKTYEIKNQPAIESEYWGPTVREQVPVLGIVFDNVSSQNWQSFSRDIWEKTQGISHLSDSATVDINELLVIKDKEMFIQKVLEYVSQSVRYVDIEVGDGKFIATASSIVHEKKYGDCKDMAYYAIAILEKGGVTAHPVLARTCSVGPVFDSFPAAQFNHVIIAVELDSNSSVLKNIEIDDKPCLIADLTDKYTIPPMIGKHLENTRVLPITETGSILLTLSTSASEKSMLKYDISMTLKADRSIDVSLSETLSGHSMAREKSLRESRDTREKDEMYRQWVQKRVPGAEVRNLIIANEPNSETQTYIQFKAYDMGTEMNNLLYFSPNVIDATRKNYKKRKRQSDLLKSYLFTKQINIELGIDSVFQINSIPEDTEQDNPFFYYSLKTHRDGQSVKMEILFSSKITRVSVEDYPAYRKMYKKYLKSVKSQIVLDPSPNLSP